MRFAVMIEGQEDVDWERLASRSPRRLRAARVRGAVPLGPLRLGRRRRPRAASLDAWGTICGLAAIDVDAAARDARLAGHVPPSLRARQVRGHGRPHLRRADRARASARAGTSAEHRAYGFPFPPMKERMDRLAEQLEIIARLVGADGPFSFARRALRGRGARRAAQAGPATAAAADGRRRDAARRGARRALRGGVQRRPRRRRRTPARPASGSRRPARRPAATRRR